MAYRIALVLCGMLLIGGCSSIRTVDSSGEDAAFRDVNRAVRGKVATMRLRDGTKMHVVGLHVDADRVTWVDRKQNRIESLATDQVREISVVKAGAGAIRGLLFGVVVGAAAGGVRAVTEGNDPVSDPLAVTREEKLRIYPAAHALYASLLTTPLGAIIGTRRVFRLEPGEAPIGNAVTKR